jgi:hypothetical protein
LGCAMRRDFAAPSAPPTRRTGCFSNKALRGNALGGQRQLCGFPRVNPGLSFHGPLGRRFPEVELRKCLNCRTRWAEISPRSTSRVFKMSKLHGPHSVWRHRSPSPQRRPHRKWEASNKFYRAHSAFAFELNLQQENCPSPRGNQHSPISKVMDDSRRAGPAMNWQSPMDFKFLRRILTCSYECKGTRPRIHRPDQPIEMTTVLRPIDPARFSFEFGGISRF